MIIEFPAPAPLLNLNKTMHWTTKASLVKEWRKAAFLHTRQYINTFRWKIPLAPSTIKFTLPVTSTKTRRDAHNFIPTCKAATDGMVDAGLFTDDSVQYVTMIDPEFWTGRMVLVEIHPRQP